MARSHGVSFRPRCSVGGTIVAVELQRTGCKEGRMAHFIRGNGLETPRCSINGNDNVWGRDGRSLRSSTASGNRGAAGNVTFREIHLLRLFASRITDLNSGKSPIADRRQSTTERNHCKCSLALWRGIAGEIRNLERGPAGIHFMLK